MSALKLLIPDGNDAARNGAMQAIGGALSAERYAIDVRRYRPDAEIDIVFPADGPVDLPGGKAIADYDGMILGGSGLHVFDDDPMVTRQLDLMRAALDAGLPVLGSCWGLQVGAVVTGGDVAPSPNGREVGVARKVRLNEAGRAHPMYAGKAAVFDSPCIHYDEVTALPAAATVLASNHHSPVQAAVIPHGAGLFWGVQYHPEFDMPHIADIYVRYRDDMVGDGFFADDGALDAHVGDIRALVGDPSRRDLRWQLGIDDDVLDADVRCLEIKNWLDYVPTHPR